VGWRGWGGAGESRDPSRDAMRLYGMNGHPYTRSCRQVRVMNGAPMIGPPAGGMDVAPGGYLGVCDMITRMQVRR